MDLAAVRLEAAGGELQHEAIYAIPANVSIWYVVEAPPNQGYAYAEFPDDEAAALAFCSAVNYRRERLGEGAQSGRPGCALQGLLIRNPHKAL